MSNATQITSDFKGDHLSVRMFGAKGDAVIITDAAMTASSGTLTSASSSFSTAIIGKVIGVKGAGASGANLYGKITAVGGSTTLTISPAAGTNVTNATAVYGTDDTVAIQNGIASNRQLYLPIGNFLITNQLVMKDLLSFRFYGEGWPSVLVPVANITNNLIDCSGSNDIEFHHFQVNGALFPDVSAECIFGDGTTANPTYGNARVYHCFFNHWGPLCLGIGANSDVSAHTVSTVEYHHNYFYDCGWGSFQPNVIDTGSSGVKLNFTIHDNVFQFVTSNPTNPPNAIFMGHGTNIGFDCHNNTIVDAPTTGIAVYKRSFASEATIMIGINVHDNVIINPGWNGISNFGGCNVKICDNVIMNPGQAGSSILQQRLGIYLSDGTTGGLVTTTQATNVKVSGNLIVDTQATPTMMIGIEEFNLGTVPCDGMISDNIISGFITADIQVLSGMAIFRRLGGTQLQVGMASATEALNILGESRSESLNGAALFVQTMIRSAVSAGQFLLGYGLNLRYDGTNFVSGDDGSSNGFAAILTNYGTGVVYLLAGNNTGGSPQTISPSSILGKTFLRYDSALLRMILENNVAITTSLGIGLGTGVWAASGYSLDVSGGDVRINNTNTLSIGGNADGTPLTVYGGGKFRGLVELTTSTVQLDALAGGGTQPLAVNNSGQLVIGSGGGGVSSLAVSNPGPGGAVLSESASTGAVTLTLTQPGSWTSYIPTTSNFTYSSSDAAYVLDGKRCTVRIEVTGTTTGGVISIGLPAIPASANQVPASYFVLSGSTYGTTVWIVSGVTLATAASFSSGFSYKFVFSMVYETT